MGKGTTVLEEAEASKLPVLADFSLVLCPEAFYVPALLFLCVEVFLGLLYRKLLKRSKVLRLLGLANIRCL